jgi:hypothetical protein
MNTRPALLRSIPFWILVVASIVSIVIGAWLFVTKIGQMQTAITSQSQTAAVDVYVGQSVAVLAAALVGAGAIGILIALAVAAIATLRPTAVDVFEAVEWTAEDTDEPSTAQQVPAQPVGAEAVAAEPVAPAPAPTVDAAPAPDSEPGTVR